jgi:hypothetical protein
MGAKKSLGGAEAVKVVGEIVRALDVEILRFAQDRQEGRGDGDGTGADGPGKCAIKKRKKVKQYKSVRV